MSWTLEFDGEEKSLAAWGLSDRVVRRRGNQAPDEVTVMAPGAMEAAAAWSYGDEVIIRRDRSGTPLAGGSIYFRGKVGLPARSGSGTGEGVTHRFVGPWWDFERCVCQQTWKEFAGWSTPGDPNTDPTFTDRVTSELFLGQGVDGARVTTGGVIAEAVAWAATCGVAVQAGVIDPTTEFPIYNCRDMTVAEVIVQMLRWTPDVICWFDYATSPPTFHCRKLANLTAVDVSADGVLSGVELVPKFDLQLPAVCLRFKRTDTVDGRPSVVWTEQNAPEGATGRELGASMHTIELMGSQTNNVYADLECVDATPAQSAVAADRIGWWARKEPLLGSEYLDGVAVSIANVFDDESAAYTLVYEPNELVSGAVADWMTVDESPVVAKKVTVKAGATYDLYRVPVRRNVGVLEVFTGGVWTASNTDKFLVEKGRRKELSANIRITNGTSGTYSALGSYTAGEGVPAGLAADIYEAHSVLQYEGQLVFVGVDVPANLGMGCKINLTVGAVTYANLLVQAVAEDVGAGRMTVSVGPASHLGLGDLVELLRVNRYRLTINNPRTRTTSTVSGDGTVTLGKATSRENTTTGLGERGSFGVSAAADANTNLMKMDAAVGEFRLEQVDSAGAAVGTAGSATAALGDTDGKEIKFREVILAHRATEGGALVSQKFRVWTSEPFGDPIEISGSVATPSIDPGYDYVNGGTKVIYGITVDSDDSIIVVGDFVGVNGGMRTGLATFDATLNLMSPSSFLTGSGVQGTPGVVGQEVGMVDHGPVIFGSNFGYANGRQVTGSCYLSPSGAITSWTAPSALSIVPGRNRIARLAGNYWAIQTYYFNGERAGGLVKVSQAGAVVGGFDPGTGISPNFGILCASAPGTSDVIYLAAQVDSYNTTDLRPTDASTRLGGRMRVIRLNGAAYDGSWEMPATNQFAGSIAAMCMLGEQLLICGGGVDNYGAIATTEHPEGTGGTGLAGFALMGTNGGVVGWTGVVLTSGAVTCMLAQSDGKVLVCAGNTNPVTVGAATGYIIRLDADGDVDTSFTPPTLTAADTDRCGIYAVAVQSDGRIVIGGTFSAIDGQARAHIAILDPSGALL